VTDQTDNQLLRAYAERRLETAFTELVRRHVDFTYSAAIRMVRDPHLAEDVTQGVFVALAKQAPELLGRATLAGWLHRTAQNIAAQTVRTIERRRARELEAVAMNEVISSAPEASWEQIEPHLDAALGELADSDRDAVLLRYYEKKTATEMAAVLKISDEAAQKRVTRALEKLRDLLSKRGVRATAGALGIVISTNAIQAAPLGLTVTISATALTGTAVTASTLIAATTKTLAMTTLQKTLVTTTIAALTCAGIYEARQAAQWRRQAQALQEQQAPLTEQIEQLQQERNTATNQLANLSAELERAKSNNADLLKLRGEVSLLRRQTNQLAALLQTAEKKAATDPTANNPDNDASQALIRRENYEFAGFASPQSTVKSMFWAGNQGDVQTLLASLSPTLKAQTEAGWTGKTEEEIRAEIIKANSDDIVSGYRVTDVLKVAANEVVLTTYLEGRNREIKLRLVKINDEWKIAGKPGR